MLKWNSIFCLGGTYVCLCSVIQLQRMSKVLMPQTVKWIGCTVGCV